MGPATRRRAQRDFTLPAFLTIEGVVEPPPGELVLALRRKPRLTDLFRAAEPFTAVVAVTAVVGA